MDATERRQQEDDKDLLIHELDHRMKNILSVTHALARQTRAEGRTAQEFCDAFLGRFEALSKSLQMTAKVQSAHLPDLAQAVMVPFLGNKHVVEMADTPPVSLLQRQAMALGLILNELAANAAK